MKIPNIVIVGGGAGGLELATKLGARLGKKKRASITLIDKSPTHIWKPLLHEVAAGTINSFHDEQNYFIHAAKNDYNFQLGKLTELDRENKLISLAPIIREDNITIVPARQIPFDIVVIAVGSTCNDFNTLGASEHCIYLDSRVKAESFHQKFLDSYITAHSSAGNVEDNKLEIVIVGAGATGVELASELHYAAKQYVKLGLHEISSANVSITIIEAAPRILAALPEKIAQQAAKQLNTIGVTVLTGEQVVEVTESGIKTSSGKSISSPLKAWCAGIKAPEFLKDLGGLETNRLNQLVVKPTLQTTLDDNVFALGDCAMCEIGTGVVPPRAQAAHQQASLLANNIEQMIYKKALKPFVYTDRGSLVSLSKDDSVGTLMGSLTGNVNVHGFLAKIIYASLYRSHQLSIHGFYKTTILILSDLLGRSTGQRTKLH